MIVNNLTINNKLKLINNSSLVNNGENKVLNGTADNVINDENGSVIILPKIEIPSKQYEKLKNVNIILNKYNKINNYNEFELKPFKYRKTKLPITANWKDAAHYGTSIVAVGDAGIICSNDSGNTWKRLNAANCTSITVNGKYFYVASEKRIIRLTNDNFSANTVHTYPYDTDITCIRSYYNAIVAIDVMGGISVYDSTHDIWKRHETNKNDNYVTMCYSLWNGSDNLQIFGDKFSRVIRLYYNNIFEDTIRIDVNEEYDGYAGNDSLVEQGYTLNAQGLNKCNYSYNKYYVSILGDSSAFCKPFIPSYYLISCALNNSVYAFLPQAGNGIIYSTRISSFSKEYKYTEFPSSLGLDPKQYYNMIRPTSSGFIILPNSTSNIAILATPTPDARI